MSLDANRWTEALEVHRQHGHRAEAYIAEQIRVQTAKGDQVAVDRWKDIAAKVNKITRPA